MPRDLSIGNGNILIAFDKDALLRELYFPHVGEENQTKGEPFRFGVWIDRHFSWLPHDWKIERDYLEDALVTQVTLTHTSLPLKMTFNDGVDFYENVYLKKITLENGSDQEKEIRLFLGQDFHIYTNEIGDTGEFRPDVNGILHYKNERYFLSNIHVNGKFGIEHFAIGNKESKGLEGAWRDAEDGILSNNPIAQGSVDSVVQISLTLAPKSTQTCFYWIACGKSWDEVKEINRKVRKRGPEYFLKRTIDYWKLWVNKNPLNKDLLPAKVLRLYKRSLLITRAQINNCGSIIAGADSDVIDFNRDTYSYMWPRDAALISHAFDRAGYELPCRFYQFCNEIIEKEGYFLHKYMPSGVPASSWHPWIQGKIAQLPIQEDETALVIWALWEHYALYKDIELIRPLYKSLIRTAADFMMNYRNLETGLPLPSYDLWEERRGVLTFTVSTVYGGLIAASHFMEAFGDVELAQSYREGAKQMREGMDRYLYLEKEKRFARMISFLPDGKIEVDATLDASLYGIFAFGAYASDDPKVTSTMEQVYAKLWRADQGGGLARYENDPYYRVAPNDIGNPWFVTTLWLAQYHIARAKTHEELKPALDILLWVADHALPSGVLAEQIDPYTHVPLSVSPLTWSHGTYILAVQEYLDKLLSIEKCPACGLPKFSKFQSP